MSLALIFAPIIDPDPVSEHWVLPVRERVLYYKMQKYSTVNWLILGRLCLLQVCLNKVNCIGNSVIM
jgi:hypothetical protein